MNKNFFAETEQEPEFLTIFQGEESELFQNIDAPEILPILPLRNMVLFPGVVMPITVARPKSLKLIREQYANKGLIGCLTQRKSEIEEPVSSDLYETGTVAQIIKILEMPDGLTTVIIQGMKRFHVTDMVESEPYFRARIALIPDEKPTENLKEFEAIISSLKDLSLKIIHLASKNPQEAAFSIKNVENPLLLINLISSNIDISIPEKQELLEIVQVKDRSILLLEFLTKELQKIELKNEVQSKVRMEIDQQQREYLLHQQMKTIQQELGNNPMDREIEEMKLRASEKKWPDAVADAFNKELERLSRTNPASPDYSVQTNYLHTLLDLPWGEYSEDNFDLKNASEVLDSDHFGLEKVKERIIEHIAVLKLKGDLKSPILCLYGPPGVGKTSLGKSIAKAIGRNYVRISLGGLHDESEIRGHRKTYIGAMPGRIIQSIKKSKSSNPVFILDEIDKVGNSFRGDPASALLEVLDPEQNNSFYDNYLELDYDLSKVMFIATANYISGIHPALLDRMELIDVSGYILEEKIEIAKRHLIPKQLENHGIKKNQLSFSKKAIEIIIEQYTRESGVRELDKKIAKVCRHTARQIAFGEDYDYKVEDKNLQKILGPPEYLKKSYQGNDKAGIVTGLAWTAAGGQILSVESSLSRGKGMLTLTGNLGDVMKESAIIAMEYIKANSDTLNIPNQIYENWNLHIHIPEGAIPKDGPSAGITMATSIASVLTQRRIKKNIAMTGEITLSGRVLPVGGIKEKILAAKRADISDIILSEENRKDIEQIKDIYLKGLSFHFVNNISEVLSIALLQEKVKNPKDLTVVAKTQVTNPT